mgnify:CR=1 FL=1
MKYSNPIVALLFVVLTYACVAVGEEQDERPGTDTVESGIPGFTEVTHAVSPAGRGRQFDIGGGNQHGDELDDVPWQSLRPGDVVNIYYRESPYRSKILLSEQGTKKRPIIINGVTDEHGNRPTIDAAGARSINPHEWDIDYSNTLLLINKRHRSGRYGQNAKHYQIKNLRLTGVRASNWYIHDKKTENYDPRSRAIWSAGGQNIVLEGMIIEDNGAGLFIQAGDDPGSLSSTWTIRGCKFENNGHGARDHQIYLQAVSGPGEYNIVEGNYFGPPTAGQSSVAQLKARATGVIVRYNWFNSSHRTLDIVEAQDAIPDWMYRNYSPEEIKRLYRSSYVYGNVFVNDFDATSGQTASRPLHFGADTLDADATWGNRSGAAPPTESGMRGYESPTYFFHNTFYMRADSSDLWRGVLFDAENNNSDKTPSPGTVEAWNNIIEFAGDTRIGVMNRSGKTIWRGTNLLYTKSLDTFAESDAYANYERRGDDKNVDVVYESQIIPESAGFVDAGNPTLELKDFRLSGKSPAIGKASPLPAVLASFPVLYQPNGTRGGTIPRPSTADLGAIAADSSQ